MCFFEKPRCKYSLYFILNRNTQLCSRKRRTIYRELHKFCQVNQAMNMTISMDKTKSITFAKDPLRCKLVVQDKIIEQVSQFKYLGMVLSGCLRQIICANEYMRKDSKVRIYKTCIRPAMTYGIEIREETKKTKRILRVAEMKTLRTIMGKTRIDRIRNTDISARHRKLGETKKTILVRSREKNGRRKTATHRT